jgi:hypothetical protein
MKLTGGNSVYDVARSASKTSNPSGITTPQSRRETIITRFRQAGRAADLREERCAIAGLRGVSAGCPSKC